MSGLTFRGTGRAARCASRSRRSGGASALVFRAVLPDERANDQRLAADPLNVLRVFALGRCRIEGPQGSLGGEWLSHRPGQLFKLFVTARRASSRRMRSPTLAHAGRRAVGNVRHLVHALRERLDPDRERSDDSYILATGGGYVLDRRRVRIDVDEFEREANAAQSAFAAGVLEPALSRLQGALEACRGEFLEEETYSSGRLTSATAFARSPRVLDLIAHAQDARHRLRRCGTDAASLAELAPYGQRRAPPHRAVHPGADVARRRSAAGVLRARMWRDFGEGSSSRSATSRCAPRSGAHRPGDPRRRPLLELRPRRPPSRKRKAPQPFVVV